MWYNIITVKETILNIKRKGCVLMAMYTLNLTGDEMKLVNEALGLVSNGCVTLGKETEAKGEFPLAEIMVMKSIVDIQTKMQRAIDEVKRQYGIK